jgi:NAD+ diphosphatase
MHDLAFGGGSGLDRGQALRSDAAAQARLWAGGLVLPFWRGRPVLSEAGLGWVASGHPVLDGAAAPIFLGLDAEGRGRFAADLSHWLPATPAVAGTNPFDAGRQPHPALPHSQAFADLRQALALLLPEEGELAAMAKALVEWHRSHAFCAACGAASLPEAAGWHRRCPACGTQHFPRTDPVVIMLVTSGNRALVGRGPGWPDQMYSCLAGFIEPGETIEAAVRREVAEETGIACGAVTYVASQPWPFPASLMLGCRAEALDEAITLDPAELEDAFWISREEMAEAFAGRHPRMRPPRKGAIAQALISMWLAGRLD